MDLLALVQFLNRVGLNLAALLAIGLALHFASGVVARGAAFQLRISAFVAAGAAAVFAASRMFLLVGAMGDGANLLDPDLMALAWTTLAPATTALMTGAVLVGAGLVWSSRLMAGIGAVALAASFGLTGHVQGQENPGLLPAIAAIHVLIAGFWVAGPLTLFPSITQGHDELVGRLRRFSAIAVLVIPLMLLLGVWLAISLAGGVDALIASTYGNMLLLKLAAGVGSLALGALNKQVITARIVANPLQGRRWLGATLIAEAALLTVAIVAVAAATTIAAPAE